MRLAALSPPATGQVGLGAGHGAELRVGMTLAAARARLPDLVALPHDPLADAALLHRLARACTRYTPFAAAYPPPPDSPTGLLLDITGCAHLFGGEAALVAQAMADLAAEGLTARPALANTPDAAHALARFGVEAVGDLPVAALEGWLGENDTGDTAEALARAGLYDVGAVAALPRAGLAARFGERMVRRLARLLGEEEAPLSPPTWTGQVTASRRFAEPIARSEDVLAALEALAQEAVSELARRGMGGRGFALALARCDGHIARLSVECAAPTRDARLVLRLFAERIDSLADPLDPGFGFDAIALAVPRMEALTERQASLPDGGFERQAPPSAFSPHGALSPDTACPTALAPLLDRLAVRHGAGRVLRFVPGNSHCPEREASLVPHSAPHAEVAPSAAWVALPPGEPPARPLLLFDPPQQVRVLAAVEAVVDDEAPRRFIWRGRTWVVARAEGPERITPEWWRRRGGHLGGVGGDGVPAPGALTRDYYRVEDDAGHRFWLFRLTPADAVPAHAALQAPRWYLHGLFA